MKVLKLKTVNFVKDRKFIKITVIANCKQEWRFHGKGKIQTVYKD